MKPKYHFLIIMLCLFGRIMGQPVPSELWPVWNYQAGLDLGLHWHTNTLLKPYPVQTVLENDSTKPSELWIEQDRMNTGKIWNATGEPKVMIWPGVISQWKRGEANTGGPDYRAFYLYGLFKIRNWYANLYVRSATKEDAFVNFTPHDRPISRAGMHAGEIDEAKIGYRNAWVDLSYGRGRQIRGPGIWDNAALSYSSASYDHFALKLFYKRWTFAYFHGFLEAVQDPEGRDQVRYITGRAIQYRLFERCLVALGESTLYYGENRSPDAGYMNPVIPHLETEQNRRENIAHGNLSNAIWFVTLDCMLPRQIRISGSMIFDEFQLDQADRDQGRPDAIAWQIRAAKSWQGARSAFTLYGRYDMAGSYTYRHGSPYTCFASRGLPLAMPQGSDFYEWTGGFRWLLPFHVSLEGAYHHLEQGEYDIKQQMYVPYLEYTKIPFPAGETQTDRRMVFNARWPVYPWLHCSAGAAVQWLKNSTGEQNCSSLFVKLNLFRPLIKNI